MALKVEKSDKSKKILQFEYQVLRNLQGKKGERRIGLANVCPVYEFVESDQPNGSNFIVMKMLGNLFYSSLRQEPRYTEEA